MARTAMVHDVDAGVLASLREETLARSNRMLTTNFRHADGTSQTIRLHEHFRPRYKDEYTGETLPSAWVQAAMHEALQYFNEKVWVGVPIEQVLKDPSAKIVGSRWAVSNKNDANDPDIRARLVAQEVNTQGDVSFFAATPPPDSKHMLLSQFSTENTRNGHPHKAQLHRRAEGLLLRKAFSQDLHTTTAGAGLTQTYSVSIGPLYVWDSRRRQHMERRLH